MNMAGTLLFLIKNGWVEVTLYKTTISNPRNGHLIVIVTIDFLEVWKVDDLGTMLRRENNHLRIHRKGRCNRCFANCCQTKLHDANK
jgi:hypothetical protein